MRRCASRAVTCRRPDLLNFCQGVYSIFLFFKNMFNRCFDVVNSDSCLLVMHILISILEVSRKRVSIQGLKTNAIAIRFVLAQLLISIFYDLQ